MAATAKHHGYFIGGRALTVQVGGRKKVLLVEILHVDLGSNVVDEEQNQVDDNAESNHHVNTLCATHLCHQHKI